MNSLCKPKRTPDFTVPLAGGDPCWEFFIEERLQYNIVQDNMYQIRILLDNTLQWFHIDNYWCEYPSSKVNSTYIRYIEEIAERILLEEE